MTGYVIKRDGKKVAFDCCRITKAVEKAFKASKEVNSPQAAAWRVTAMVLKWLDEEGKDTVHLEHIQDLVISTSHPGLPSDRNPLCHLQTHAPAGKSKPCRSS